MSQMALGARREPDPGGWEWEAFAGLAMRWMWREQGTRTDEHWGEDLNQAQILRWVGIGSLFVIIWGKTEQMSWSHSTSETGKLEDTEEQIVFLRWSDRSQKICLLHPCIVSGEQKPPCYLGSGSWSQISRHGTFPMPRDRRTSTTGEAAPAHGRAGGRCEQQLK